jgi:hypothetical protein
MVLIAIANASIREKVFAKRMSELHAHQISTATGVLLFGVYMWGVMRIWRPESSGQAFIVGLLWLGLTVAFEFLFGHYVIGHSWVRLFRDYDVFAGRVWIIVLIWVTLAPYVFFKLDM